MAKDYQQIIVAVDGSEEAEYALHKAIDFAKDSNRAQLNIVHVFDARVYEAFDSANMEKTEKQTEEFLENYKAEAEAAGVENIQVITESGSAKRVITNDVAKRLSADLIVCGARGMGTVERLLIGSVSESIVRSAACDVLVVRTPESST